MGAPRSLRWMWVTASLAICLASSVSARADEVIDTVVLKSGAKLRGIVMEDDPTTGVSIKLVDGVSRQLKRDEVLRVDYGAQPSAPPAPPPAASPAPPAAPIAPPLAPLATATKTIPSLRGEEPMSRGIPAIWAPGLSIFLTGYVGGVIGTSVKSDQAKAIGFSFIPLFGQIAELADGDIHKETVDTALLVTGTIVQHAGFAIFFIGLALPRPRSIPVEASVSASGASLRYHLEF